MRIYKVDLWSRYAGPLSPLSQPLEVDLPAGGQILSAYVGPYGGVAVDVLAETADTVTTRRFYTAREGEDGLPLGLDFVAVVDVPSSSLAGRIYLFEDVPF